MCGCQSSNRHAITFDQRLPSAATQAIANSKSSQQGLKLDAGDTQSSSKVSLAAYQAEDADSTAGLILSSPPNQNGSEANNGLIQAIDDPDQNAFEISDSNSPPRSGTASTEFAFNQNSISLEQVINSVMNCYPEIEIAIGEIESASGKVLASWGEFDQILSAHSISQPLGFYQTYQNGVGLSQPLYGGGEVYGAYRIGDGNFEPWYGERETNEGGELKAGFSLPILKDRAIDARRANLYGAGFQRDQVKSNVEARLLQFQRFATQAYWDWVASGQAAQVQKRLLRLAETRVIQIQKRVDFGDLAEIARIDNDRLIAKRKNDLIKARRQFEKTAIKLSLFWRDANCQPVVAAVEQLPSEFPSSIQIARDQLGADIANALAVRPELAELAAARQEACTDLSYAENLTLPKLDLKGFAGQDIGGATSSKGDKTPFEFQLGVLAEVPLQRREGIGKTRVAQGKLTQIDAKIRFTADKIRSEIQDAASGVNAAVDQIEQSQENLELTRKSLELGVIAFNEGDIDLLSLNIYESAAADAELQLLDAQFKHFYYRTIYETAIRGTVE